MRFAVGVLAFVSFTLVPGACRGIGDSDKGSARSAPSMADVISAMRDQHPHVYAATRSPDRAPALGINLTGATFMVEGSTTQGSTTSAAGRIVVIEFNQRAGLGRLATRLSIPAHGPNYAYRRGVAAGHLLVEEMATTRPGRVIVQQAAKRVAAIASATS